MLVRDGEQEGDAQAPGSQDVTRRQKKSPGPGSSQLVCLDQRRSGGRTGLPAATPGEIIQRLFQRGNSAFMAADSPGIEF